MTVPFSVGQIPRAVVAPAESIRLVRLVASRWLLLLGGVVAGLAATLVALMLSTPVYDVSAKVFVRLGREMTPPPTLGVKDAAQIMPTAKRPEDLASEVEIFTNPRLIAQTVQSFGEDYFLAESPPETLWQHVKAVPKTVSRMLQNSLRETSVLLGLRPPTTPLERVTLALAMSLNVELVRKSDVIEVRMAYPDPRAGEAFLQRFIEFAIQNHLDVYRSSGTREFFGREAKVLAAELMGAEQRLLQLRTQRDATWSAAEQRSLLLKTEADLQLQLAQALADIAQGGAEIDRSEQTLKTIPREIELSKVQSRNRLGDDLRARLAQLELEMVTVRSRYANGSQEMMEAQRRIDFLRHVVDKEPSQVTDSVSTGPNQQYSALARDVLVRRSQLSGQRARAAEIETQLTKVRDQLVAAQKAEFDIAQGDREVARLRRSVDVYERGYEDARIADTMDLAQISNLKVVMAPTASLLPSSPSIKRYLIIGLAGGLALALGYVLMRDAWTRNTATPVSRSEVARSFPDLVPRL